MKKKTYVIACAVLAVDMRHTAETLGMDLETRFLEAGLHNNPRLLNTRLQTAIDEISASGEADRIIIGYGVCGKGTIGVRSRSIPLVIPKVHDCISLFLGGDQAYKDQFRKYPGTYYLSAGWCEENAEPMSQRRQRAWFGSEKLEFDDLVRTHGQEAATTTFKFLNSWQKNYQRAAFIETGAKQSARYESYAKEMAREYNWEYARIKGDPGLIQKMLLAEKSSREVLFVPPEHVIGFDAITSALSANPVWNIGRKEEPESPGPEQTRAPSQEVPLIRTGLGIDAGGTYTDAVIYGLRDRTTLAKAKSLTTKWDFTLGIGRALESLDRESLLSVELVALSTTLATNAIVENEGQKVGMLLMPPAGLTENIDYGPKAVIQGELDISGNEKTPVHPDQIREVADRMIRNQGVTAFAVSGYAGSINPAHELAVKKILEDHTNLFVSCGHELSDTLNFRTRAVTAMLNARIIPRLASLLADLEKVMKNFGIQAPIVVVKGDGTLMSSTMAKQRPVETILSGPAASVAGAIHLTGITDALVVDMGGTTTDTAAVADGQVSLNQSGSNVGGHRTHVKALEIRTAGLGGDSSIAFEAGEFSIGPKRVAPMAWLGREWPEATQAVRYLSENLNRYTVSTRKMQVLSCTGAKKDQTLTFLEEKVMTLLRKRPFSIDELTKKLGVHTDAGLPLERLEENFLIQRCGLTLTDLLHLTGRFVLWDVDLAREYARLFSLISGRELEEMTEELIQTGIHKLTLELLKRQLDEEVSPASLDTCPVCRALMDNLLQGRSRSFQVCIHLKRPVIGIGAPIKYFLPRAAKFLTAEAVLPEDADVANAIGAITSNVSVKKQLRIISGEQGGFIVEGIPGNPWFKDFPDADLFARDNLTRMVLDLALEAGSSSTRVEIRAEDKIARTASGDPIFMGRTLKGSLTGQPDLVIKQHGRSPAMVCP